MKSDGLAADVLIVGGGFSGTMLAAELARRQLSAVLIESKERAGRGTAFSTAEDTHLLNVPAARMGAWADQPDDFAKAVGDEGLQPEAYAPRRRYGEYLRSILDDAERSGFVTVIRGEAVDAGHQNERWQVSLADGSRIEGRALALAQGNQPPRPPALARGIPDELFVNDPWSELGRKALIKTAASGGDVLLIGTGLTMVDVVLSLDEARLRGRVVALSRRGLAPRAHADHGLAPVTLEELPQGSLRELWRWLLDRGAAVGWRAAVDSLRPHSHALWQSLGEEQQRRFLRHARPWWDVHRHRIAPEIAGRIQRLVQLGQLEIFAGRVTDMWVEGNQLGVTIKRRGKGQGTEHRFALAVNCTGPLGAVSDSSDPLIKSLFESELARADVLDLGLEVDERSRLTGAPLAWALGPMTKGRYWEITAVPDIRGQVAQVAKDIAEELNR